MAKHKKTQEPKPIKMTAQQWTEMTDKLAANGFGIVHIDRKPGETPPTIYEVDLTLSIIASNEKAAHAKINALIDGETIIATNIDTTRKVQWLPGEIEMEEKKAEDK